MISPLRRLAFVTSTMVRSGSVSQAALKRRLRLTYVRSGFATKVFVDQVEEASVFRDESIKADLEDKDRKQTAAILVVEGDVQRYNSESKARDDKLQEQIDAIEIPDAPSTDPNVGDKAGSLNWVDYTFSGDTIDALSKQARIHPERTKMALNKD